MNDTTLTIRTTNELKEKASKIYEDMGINLSIAVNIFMRQSILKNKFPCSLDVSSSNGLTRKKSDKFLKLFGSAKNMGFDKEPDDIKVSHDGDIAL